MKLISSSLVPCRPHFEADCFVTPLSQLDENRLICGKKEKNWTCREPQGTRLLVKRTSREGKNNM